MQDLTCLGRVTETCLQNGVVPFLKWQPCHFPVTALCFVVLVYANVVQYPASKARREVANLTERKNPHAPLYAYGVKESV